MSFKLNRKRHVQILSVFKRNKPLFCSAEKFIFSPNIFFSRIFTARAIESVNVGNLIFHLTSLTDFPKIGIRYPSALTSQFQPAKAESIQLDLPKHGG